MAKSIQQLLAEAKLRSQPKISTIGELMAPIEAELSKRIAIQYAKLDERIAIEKAQLAAPFDPYDLGNNLRANKEQHEAITRFGLKGESGCLIGPAGTGKTTTTKAITRAWQYTNQLIPLAQAAHKYLRDGTPGVFGGSFTKIATRNLRNQMPEELQSNIHTIHRLLEFEPVFYEVGDKNTVRFEPTRHALRPLPDGLRKFLLDESSMISVELFTLLQKALRRPDLCQFLFIGDIAQLPPVFDTAILGYKLLDSPVVELKEVYRHAGRIVALANHIRVGKTIPDNKIAIPWYAKLYKMPRKLAEDGIAAWNGEEDGSKVTIHLWKSRLQGEVGELQACQNLGRFFGKEMEAGSYDYRRDMILVPYNKAVGSIEINNFISDYIDVRDKRVVYEVIAGRFKKYFAVGDKVFFDREEAEIIKIETNPKYLGKLPMKASEDLNRWGQYRKVQLREDEDENNSANRFADLDALLSVNIDEDDTKNSASHCITIRKYGEDTEKDTTISETGAVNELLIGYALTIHKSQGSQWPKVYCIFHNSHNRNLQRESLYTAITRAQKELYVICEPETFIQGVISQHIKGNFLAEKAWFFKGKKEEDAKKQEVRNKLFNTPLKDRSKE